jgi:eukaryotic-like serine/threonine-protein kinase
MLIAHFIKWGILLQKASDARTSSRSRHQETPDVYPEAGSTGIMQQFQEGLVFAGRYRIVRCIAAGGMGTVYEVIHLETERRRALKVMLPHVLHSPELRERFKREARIAAHIESEFIVDVFDAGVDELTQMPYLVMELLRGEELGQRLARLGRLPPEEVVTYLRQLAIALDKTHLASIVHRDLKPENLFLTSSAEGLPRIKVLDFGIAKIVAENATHDNATRSLGTPLYMAPEQFLTRPITGAADIYALGLLTYTFLVGAPYWDVEARTENGIIAFGMIAVHGPREPASLRSSRRGVTLSSAFDLWFSRATAVNPAERFPTAISAVSALAEALLPAPAVYAPSAEAATRLLPSRLPSTPELEPFRASPQLMPTPAAPVSSTAVLRIDGSPQIEEPSTRSGAMGVTVARPLQSGRGLVVAAAFGIVAIVGVGGAFTLLRHKSPAGAEPVLSAVALPASSSPAALTAAPTEPSSVALLPPAIALSASSLALPEQPPIASAGPEGSSAPVVPSASGAPPPSSPPTVLAPGAGRKGGTKPRNDSSSDFRND